MEKLSITMLKSLQMKWLPKSISFTEDYPEMLSKFCSKTGFYQYQKNKQLFICKYEPDSLKCQYEKGTDTYTLCHIFLRG